MAQKLGDVKTKAEGAPKHNAKRTTKEVFLERVWNVGHELRRRLSGPAKTGLLGSAGEMKGSSEMSHFDEHYERRRLPPLVAGVLLCWVGRARGRGPHGCQGNSRLVARRAARADQPAFNLKRMRSALRQSSSAWLYFFWSARAGLPEAQAQVFLEYSLALDLREKPDKCHGKVLMFLTTRFPRSTVCFKQKR